MIIDLYTNLKYILLVYIYTLFHHWNLYWRVCNIKLIARFQLIRVYYIIYIFIYIYIYIYIYYIIYIYIYIYIYIWTYPWVKLLKKVIYRSFQRFNSLPITGKADLATIQQMDKPRCGVPDIQDLGGQPSHGNLPSNYYVSG